MHQFTAKRATGTLRWSIGEDGNQVNVYISSKQVPQPMPSLIRVSLYEDGENRQEPVHTHTMRGSAPGISLHLMRKTAGEHLVRFDPEGNPASWPVGSILLPLDILENKETPSLELLIDWVDAQ